MILFMTCEEAVYTLANLGRTEDKHREELVNCILSHTPDSYATLELPMFWSEGVLRLGYHRYTKRAYSTAVMVVHRW